MVVEEVVSSVRWRIGRKYPLISSTHSTPQASTVDMVLDSVDMVSAKFSIFSLETRF